MAITYRTAVSGDTGALMGLLRLMHRENGLAPMSEAKVLAKVAEVLERGQIIVAERDGAMVGSIGVIAESWWYSDAEHLIDSWIFVHPDHRRSTAIVGLLKAAKAISKTMNLQLFVGLVGPKDIERKAQLFSRDMEVRGILFVKEP